jgi:hypothetical protein
MAHPLHAGTVHVLGNALYSANEYGDEVAPHVGPAFEDWCACTYPTATAIDAVKSELTRLGYSW